MDSVFDATKKKVGAEQSSRSELLKSVQMPEVPVNRFMGMTEEELTKVNMKKLSPEEAKAWSEAMDAARKAGEAPAQPPPPPPASAVPALSMEPPMAEQPTEATGAF